MKKEDKNILSCNLRPALAVVWLCFMSFDLLSQIPQIKTIDKPYANPLQTVSLNGLNFGTDPTKLVVYFGGAKGSITSVSDQLLEAQAPFGTTFDKVKVFNTSTGLGSESRGSFFLDFGGANPIQASNLQAQVDFASGSGLYDHCLCDFDGDAKLDIATANSNVNSISFYKNTSSVGSFNFTSSTAAVGTITIHSTCGDLNGDGLPDLVVSEANGGSRIFVFKNTGTLPLTMSGIISLTGVKVKRLEIADLDRDGKSELIVTDQGNPKVIILPNQSTLASILFGAPVAIPVTGFTSTDGSNC
ncbi:MAG: FG-GAP-like repeat-containing protein [Cyclobacteriaceae bacterium]